MLRQSIDVSGSKKRESTPNHPLQNDSAHNDLIVTTFDALDAKNRDNLVAGTRRKQKPEDGTVSRGQSLAAAVSPSENDAIIIFNTPRVTIDHSASPCENHFLPSRESQRQKISIFEPDEEPCDADAPRRLKKAADQA